MHSHSDKKNILIIASLLLYIAAESQLPEYHVRMLTDQQGLNVSDIISLAKDEDNFLWLASQGSIQRYDGRNSKLFDLDETIESIFADNKNRKWVITRRGIYLFKNDYIGFVKIRHATKKTLAGIFNAGENLYLLTAGGIEIFDEKQQCFVISNILGKRITKSISGLYCTSGNTLFFCTSDTAYSFDFYSKKLFGLPFKEAFLIAALADNEILITDQDSRSFHINFNQGTKDELAPTEIPAFRKNQFIRIFSSEHLNDNRFLVGTTCGLLYYDRCTKKFAEPVIYHKGTKLMLDNSAIRHIYRDSYGTIYMTHPEGIALFSASEKPLHFLKTYTRNSQSLPDIDIRGFAEDKDGKIYMATINGLSSIDMHTGQLENFYPEVSENSLNNPSLRNLLFYKNKLWIGTGGKGVWIFNTHTKMFTRPRFTSDTTGQKTKQLMNEEYVWKLAVLKNGDLIAAGSSRCYRINHKTEAASVIQSSVPLVGSRTILVDSSGRTWHGGNRGLKCYDNSFNLLFYVRDSLADKRVAAITPMSIDKYLIGSRGLYLATTNSRSLKSFKKIEAFPSNRFIYCMEKDINGNVWIGTDAGLYRYNFSTGEIIMLDANDNIQPQTFNSNAMFINSKGVLFAGGKSGINYFNPVQFYKKESALKPIVSTASVGNDDSSYFLNKGILKTNFFNRNLLITISSPEYVNPGKIRYRFKLKQNAEWISNGSSNTIRLFNLKPGDYSFTASVSNDGKKWFNTAGPITFIILKPWWQQWWFRISCLSVLFGVIVFIKTMRDKKRREQENKKTIEYFSNSGYEHSTVEDILWDIARNCISRLGFEECVIYLVDEKRPVLVQKAAYGAKSPKNFEIINPIEIPLGSGIVGHVAETGVAEIISDTSKDKRYILDDEARLSEIAVPIIYHDRVIGVIDSEHKKKNFFTIKHLDLLQSIATISAAKISRGMVLERMLQAKKELTELNIKMIETQFLNLRLQMNPHFLFNSLSSIQHLIVSNQTNEAYKYLTVFSHFLRSVLKYADKTFITLKEEIQMLEMYIKLESLGFDKTFNYDICIDDELDTEDILIPPLMIQPLVENAIWHGLVHKNGEKHFLLKFFGDEDDNLVCIVEDNGVGRIESKVIQSSSLHEQVHESKATGLLRERLELLTQKTSRNASVCYEDRYENNKPAGTRVLVTIPYYNTIEV